MQIISVGDHVKKINSNSRVMVVTQVMNGEVSCHYTTICPKKKIRVKKSHKFGINELEKVKKRRFSKSLRYVSR